MRSAVLLFSASAVAVLGICAPDCAQAASAAAPLPSALSDLVRFRGRIDYVALRDGSNYPTITGSLVVGDQGFAFEERTVRYDLRADATGSTLAVDGQTGIVSDPFETEPLANAWAALAGMVAGHAPDGSGARVWTAAASGIRMFVDVTGTRLIGIEDAAGRSHVSDVFDDWAREGPLWAPRRIMRMRGAAVDAVFDVTQYSVAGEIVSPGGRAAAALEEPPVLRRAAPAFRTIGLAPFAVDALGLQLAGLACGLILIASGLVWAHRDALVLACCKRMARDPRGWRRAGTSIFVGPGGTLHFAGMRYRVGPHFYNRAVLVQTSVLFLRVSAPGAPRPVVLPRKFAPVDLGIRSRGMTLVETLTAMAIFSAIVLFGVFPALTALSQACARAQYRSSATRIAANALADEQAACEYGNVAEGTVTTQVDTFTLTVTVLPDVKGIDNEIDVTVSDANGTALAKATTLVGPPVKSPPQTSGGPPGG